MIEEKLKEAFKSAGLGNGSIFWNNILTICQEAITEAKEEGFNAGCDFTCKKYGDSKTENDIRIEENEYWLAHANRFGDGVPNHLKRINRSELKDRIKELSQENT